MNETIFELARTVSGAGEAEAELLAALCEAAEAAWAARLRSGVAAADCGTAFACAAAFTAAADLAAGSCGGVVSFTAGEISVKARGTAEEAAGTALLRQTAERLMAPYAEAEDFSFRGVRG